MSLTISSLDASAADSLADILIGVVSDGYSVGFMHPLSRQDALAYWREALADAETGGRLVLGAWAGERLIGTVTLYLDLPPNQPHRAEIWKLQVDGFARKGGVGEALMRAAEAEARVRGRTILVLDTVTGSPGSRLYERLDWVKVGDIPDYALMPDGSPCSATFYFKALPRN